MTNPKMKCPCCNSWVEGKFNRSNANELTRTGAKALLKSGMGASPASGMKSGVAIGTALGGPVGAVVGGAIGAVAGTYMSDKINEKVDEVGNYIETQVSVGFDFICPKCGKKWTRQYKNGQLTETDEYINKKKIDYIKSLEPHVVQSVISFILSGAIFGGSLYYCIVNDSMIYGTTTLLGIEMQTSNPNLTWWFLGLVVIVFLFITLFAIGAIGKEIEKGKAIKKIEKMSPQEFYESEYWSKAKN